MMENTGTITIDSDTLEISFNHGLPQMPTIVAVYTPDANADGGDSPSTFRSIVAGVVILRKTDANIVGVRGYNSAGSPSKGLSGYCDYVINSTSVTITSTSTAYKFKAGKTYTWRAIV